MKKDIQEAQEQFHFELFKKRYEEWRDGEEKRGKDKEPDFLIKYPDETLGIELTEPYRPKAKGQIVCPAKREGSLRKVVEDAQIIYEKKSVPTLYVNVFFNPTTENIRIKTSQLRQLSKTLAELIEVWNKNNPSSSSDILRPGSKIPEISHIAITRITSCDKISWTKEGAFWNKTDCISDLQKRINEKNEKYEEYRKNCDDCWLLMVANKWNPAQGFDVDFSDKVTDHTYQSKFSKTFYLEVTDESLIELKTTCQ